MKLILEADPEMYERIASGELSVLECRLRGLEAAQEGGLLTTERRVTGIEQMTGVVAKQRGLAEGAGPPIRVHLASEEGGG